MNAGPLLVDTHAHLDDRRLKGRLAEVLEGASQAGVIQIIAIATTASNSQSVIELARANPGVFAAVGIHPNDVVEAGPEDWKLIQALARNPEVVAIGETGLDLHWDRTPFDRQQISFGLHLELARELDKPIIIHSRDCHDEIVRQLQSLERPVRGVLHSFTGNWSQAQGLLDLGLQISFAGMLTYANKSLESLRDAARQVPIDRILVETDSPYLSPHPHRGKDNEPARVVHTTARLAEIRGISVQEMAEATTANARRLFRLPSTSIIPRSQKTPPT